MLLYSGKRGGSKCESGVELMLTASTRRILIIWGPVIFLFFKKRGTVVPALRPLVGPLYLTFEPEIQPGAQYRDSETQAPTTSAVAPSSVGILTA